MWLTDRFRHAFRIRIRDTCSRYLSGRLVTPFFDKRVLAAQQWNDALQEAGVELEEIIRVRKDTRGIFLVKHPHRGLCVLKTLFTTRHPRQALANQVIARRLSDCRAPIFSRVYEMTPSYTLEEYIDGPTFRCWMDNGFEEAPVRDFFQSLKRWSTSSGDLTRRATMRPYEIREICRAYLTKCLSHARYFPTMSHIESAVRFSRISDRLAHRIEWLWNAAERVELPRGLMCGDMGNINILVRRSTSSLYNIDCETLGPGHYGFDCAYFISSLVKMEDDELKLDSIKRMVLNDEYLGGSEARAFFEVYTKVLSDISTIIYEPARSNRA